MTRLILSILAVALGVSGCTVNGATSWGPVPSGDLLGSTVAPQPSASSTASPIVREVEVWFVRETRQTGEGGRSSARRALYQTGRSVEPDASIEETALAALLAGPSALEAESGVLSPIPPETMLLGFSLEDTTARVDVDSALASGDDVATMRMRLAQVVHTLTQFPTIERVAIDIEGVPLSIVLESMDIDLQRPLQRRQFDDLLPAIVVQQPLIGARVASGFRVRGTANVFEATVSIRLLDDDDAEITRAFTTATCGTGCRGDFERRIRFDVETEQAGTLEVYEASALDGSATNLVRIPVTLVP